MDYDSIPDDDLDDLDLDIDIEMPETPVSQRGRGRHHYRPGTHNVSKAGHHKLANGNESKNKKDNRNATSMLSIENNLTETTKENGEQDPQETLRQSLKEQLTDCSSQRLRCVHMTLRRLANVDNRISEKDMLLAFQENHVNLTSRLTQIMSDTFGEPQGIDYERLYKCLVSAHNLTGRDSVKARRKKSDLTSRPQMSQEKRDADFLSRIELQLIRDQTFFDIDMLREEFQTADSHRTGKIKTEQMMLICSEKTPLYGALLVNLLRRCDEDKNDTVSWPTLLNFMERGQNIAREKDPELHLLPEKARATAAVNVAPDPISELSSGTKAKLVSKLMRKASSRSGGNRAGSSLSNAPSVTTPPSSRDTSPDPASKSDGKTISADSNKDKPANSESKTKDSTKTTQENIPEQGNKSNKDGKKKDAAEKVEAKAAAAFKELPVIEVDKASETEHSLHENESRESSSAASPPAPVKDTASTSEKATPTSTTTTATATTTVTTTTTSSSSASNNQNPSVDASKSQAKEVAKAEKSRRAHKSGIKLPVVKGVEVALPQDYSPPDIPVDPPNERLQLDWVYGCRGNDCRRNMQTLASGEVIYFIANICILLDQKANEQRHYKEHTEDIKSLAIHSNGILVASGQFASKLRPENVAHVRVWRSDLLQTTHVLGAGVFSKAVMCLAFMPDQDYLAAIDSAPDKQLTMWDLNIQDSVARTYVVTETICDMDFNPKYPDLLVTCGKEHLQWWKFYPGFNKLHNFTTADYENYLKAKYVVCAVHTDKGDLITGDSNGTVYIWGDGGNKITNFVKHGHEGPVLSVLYHKGYLLSGGRDGQIMAWTWDRNMDKATSLQIPGSEGGIRNLMVKDGVLILCTTMNSVLSITLSTNTCPLDGVSLDPVPITQGHYDELRAVTVIQNSFLGADILTAGSDGVLCKFASSTHAPIWKLYVKGMQYLCVDSFPTGDFIILGTRDGRVVVLQINKTNLQVMEVLNNKVTTGSILSIRLCPDLRWMAAGGDDGSIYVFRLTEQEEGEATWNVWGILKGHKGEVVSLDWTKQAHNDGVCLLRSGSSSPQQKFWNIQSCTEVDGNELDKLSWATETCTLDHLLIGVWNSKQAEHAQVKAVDVNSAQSLVAMGNSAGLLSLYRYPSTKDRVYSHTYQAHQTVQGTRFTPDGQRIVTVGGHDSALLQWKLI